MSGDIGSDIGGGHHQELGNVSCNWQVHLLDCPKECQKVHPQGNQWDTWKVCWMVNCEGESLEH